MNWTENGWNRVWKRMKEKKIIQFANKSNFFFHYFYRPHSLLFIKKLYARHCFYWWNITLHNNILLFYFSVSLFFCVCLCVCVSQTLFLFRPNKLIFTHKMCKQRFWSFWLFHVNCLLSFCKNTTKIHFFLCCDCCHCYCYCCCWCCLIKIYLLVQMESAGKKEKLVSKHISTPFCYYIVPY